jgi:hypothetical protein
MCPSESKFARLANSIHWYILNYQQVSQTKVTHIG